MPKMLPNRAVLVETIACRRSKVLCDHLPRKQNGRTPVRRRARNGARDDTLRHRRRGGDSDGPPKARKHISIVLAHLRRRETTRVHDFVPQQERARAEPMEHQRQQPLVHQVTRSDSRARDEGE